MARKRTPAEMRKGWLKRKQRFGASGNSKKTPYQKSLARKAAKLSGRKPKMLQEWFFLAENIFGYIDYVENANVLANSVVKSDIVERVMKERYLKKNTILVNLQNPKYFKKNKQGLYSVSA
jgi:predicted ATPase